MSKIKVTCRKDNAKLCSYFKIKAQKIVEECENISVTLLCGRLYAISLNRHIY